MCRAVVLSIALFVFALGLFSAPALADDATIDLTFNDWSSQTVRHDPELFPFKGWAFITVHNSSQNAWGDFHFEISGAATDAAQVLFVMDPPALISTQNPTNWMIGTTPGGFSKLDAYFYNDPILPGETATFQVYTDNTAVQNAWFGISMWPTPVPEPASLLFLGLGAGLMLRRRR